MQKEVARSEESVGAWLRITAAHGKPSRPASCSLCKPVHQVPVAVAEERELDRPIKDGRQRVQHDIGHLLMRDPAE